MKSRETFKGRVDVLQMSGKRLSVRTQIEGTYIEAVDFVEKLRSSFERAGSGARFIAGELNEMGYDAKVEKPTVSMLGGMALIECNVMHSEPSDRNGRIIMDTYISRLIDDFHLKFNTD